MDFAFSVFISNFEQVSSIVQIFLFLTSVMFSFLYCILILPFL